MLHDPSRVREMAAIASPASKALGVTRLHRIGLLGRLAFLLYAVATAAYFAYRIPLWNPDSPVFSGLMLAAELFGTMTLLLHVFSTWTLVERQAPPPGDFEADILITTWNEPLEILRNTLLAARQVRHARNVWLLDDGCRPEMEALAAELGVRYVARADRSHAKAGNLNHALQLATAPFVAIFDCDHAPSAEFLERTLGYFQDPGVAFVQTPQDFYNTGSFQHRGSAKTREAWHEQTLFYRVIQPGKDYWNAGFFCGSCAVMRRSALEDIGGIATGTITEDMHTSLRLHKRGWASVYHGEALAFGLSPATLEQYDTQRLRWGRGAMQVWLKEGLLFRGKLTLAQRLAYFMSTITYFEGWQKAIIYFLPMAVLLTGSMPIIWAGWPFIAIFLAWFGAGIVVNEIFSRGYAKTIWTEECNFFRFFTFMKATLALFIPINWRFAVTPKGRDTENGLPVRLWPQLLVALGAMLSIAIGSYIYMKHHHLPEGAYIANLVWLVVNSAIAIKALSFAAGRRHQKRTEHRFPLPFIAMLHPVGSNPTATVAFDVSSHGMSLKVPADAIKGEVVEGELLLPSGPWPFRAGVRHRAALCNSSDVLLGVAFDWSRPDEADALNACLYGNTLQWDVNSWREVRSFQLAERVRGWTRRNGSERDWLAAILSHAHGQTPCLVSNDAGGFKIFSHAMLVTADEYMLQIDGQSIGELKIAAHREYSVGGGHVTIALLSRDSTGELHFHREPRWSSNVSKFQ